MWRHWTNLSAGLCLCSLPALAQTAINLRTQAKDVDFSAASSTKPFRTGTTLPATCTVGEAFLLTSAPAEQSFYICVTGVWTLIGGGTGGGSTPARVLNAGPGIVIQNGDGVAGDPVISIDDAIVTQYSSGAVNPTGSCDPGRLHYRTDTQGLWFCGAGDTWRELATLTA